MKAVGEVRSTADSYRAREWTHEEEGILVERVLLTSLMEAIGNMKVVIRSLGIRLHVEQLLELVDLVLISIATGRCQ